MKCALKQMFVLFLLLKLFSHKVVIDFLTPLMQKVKKQAKETKRQKTEIKGRRKKIAKLVALIKRVLSPKPYNIIYPGFWIKAEIPLFLI